MKTKRKVRSQVIVDYDNSDTTSFVNANKPLLFSDIGVSLPSTPPLFKVNLQLFRDGNEELK